MLLDQGDQAAVPSVVYRDAIERRQSARHPDKYQTVFAQAATGSKFLIEHGQAHGESQELLQSARTELESAGDCFDVVERKG